MDDKPSTGKRDHSLDNQPASIHDNKGIFVMAPYQVNYLYSTACYSRPLWFM